MFCFLALLHFVLLLSKETQEASPDRHISHSCSQPCKPQNGISTCVCRQEVQLKNNKTCTPIDTTHTPIYTTKTEMFYQCEYEKKIQIANGSDIILATTFDAKNHVVFWTLHGNDSKFHIYKANLSDYSSEELEIRAARSFGGMAYDWITSNMYLTIDNLVQVCNLNKGVCADLINLNASSKISNIALHPNKGLMFFATSGHDGQNYSLVRAKMDGSSLRAIFNDGIKQKTEMAVDYENERVFWVDGYKRTIESCSFIGEERRSFNLSSNFCPVALVVLDSRIYWMSESLFEAKCQLQNANKLDGSDETRIELEFDPPPRSFTLLHSGLQPFNLSNPCKNTNCSHICIPTSNSTGQFFRCLCPPGMVLVGGNLTCLDSRGRQGKSLDSNPTYLNDREEEKPFFGFNLGTFALMSLAIGLVGVIIGTVVLKHLCKENIRLRKMIEISPSRIKRG